MTNKKSVMKIKPLLFAMLSLSCSGVFAQESADCDPLAALLKYEKARKVFLFDQHKESPITFVDVKLFFRNCNIGNYYGRKVEIVHDSTYLRTSNFSNYIINNYTQTQHGYKISVFYKKKNALFTTEFKKKNNKLVVTRFEGGYF
jgi:hypothetical protein